ncbi:MAG: NAD-dependent epimerase/dehydratase family protein [Oligoflexia bacterium]|nr:NAD-dependent epimerase/dehydratase family protein [Oligoflexia bacterium]
MSDSGAVLVTGATGYLGANLCRRLAVEGREVHALVRPNSDRNLLYRVLGDARGLVRLHEHDPSRPGATERLIAQVIAIRPKSCFHLASLFKAVHRPEDIAGLIEGNLLFGAQLAEALVSAGTGVLVNTGTSWQNFEGRPYSPVSLYAATKQAYQDLLAYYAAYHDEDCGLRIVHLKLTDTYGPGDPRRKVLNLLLQAAASGERLEMSGGEQLVDLVYLDDVLEGFLCAEKRCEALPAGVQETYRLSSGEPVTLRALVGVMERALQRSLEIGWGKLPYRRREMFSPWAGEPPPPGWSPRISLLEGLQRVMSR